MLPSIYSLFLCLAFTSILDVLHVFCVTQALVVCFFMEANCGRLLPHVEGAGANQPDHHPTPRIGGQEPGETFIRRKICG